MVVEAGTRVGPYLIHEYLGQGDLGHVFRACDAHGRSVAVKVLRSLAVPHLRDRLAALARRLSDLHHSNLLTILEFGDYDGVPYLIQPYVPGGCLGDHLRAGLPNQPVALWLLRSIAAGIDHAHEAGFVHGALKPNQVVLDAEDQPFVTDFGLAPLRWPRPDGGPVPVSQHNAPYAAPEVVVGCRPTPASDRYSFATIAHHLLTGRTPFQGELSEVLAEQLDVDPHPPSVFNDALSPRIDAVILSGLSKDPAARWRCCTDMVEALADAMCPPEPAFAVQVPKIEPETATEHESDNDEHDPPNGVEAEEIRLRGAASSAAADRPHKPWTRWGFMAGALLVLAVGSAATWLTSQPPGVSITVSTPTVGVGGSLIVAATNLPPSQVGIVQLHSDPQQIGIFRADDHGNTQTPVTIPQDATPGEHTISLCWDDTCHGLASITITTADASQESTIPAVTPGTPLSSPTASPTSLPSARSPATPTQLPKPRTTVIATPTATPTPCSTSASPSRCR